MISLLMIIPILGSIFIYIQRKNISAQKIAILSIITQIIIELFITLKFFIIFNDNICLTEKFTWLKFNNLKNDFCINYYVGIDGINISMIILSSLITLVSVITSYNVKKYNTLYYILILITNSLLIGYFTALDMFLLYIYYEIITFSLYFLILLWSNTKNRYMTINFIIYNVLSSLILMTSIIITYYLFMHDNTIQYNGFINLSELYNLNENCNKIYTKIIFFLIFISFAIKSSLVPFHGWLPQVHVESYNSVSIILSGIILKMGIYGMLRTSYCFLYYEILEYQNILALFGLITILYGVLKSFIYKDLKKIIAYYSISHMGFNLLGIISYTYEGVLGSIFHLFSYGILTSILFIFSNILYDKVGSRQINHFSGLMSIMPKYTYTSFFIFFAYIGMPGFSSFISELLIIVGLYHNNNNILKYISFISILGLFLNALSFILIIKKIFFNNLYLKNKQNWKQKLTSNINQEIYLIIFLLLILLLIGIFPNILINISDSTIKKYIS
ncbi:MAG: NADH-quinone oxidoreductase subunit M [Bacteroides sp.]|nr:MAG: NADH-quinone oxidoreductase subunit M [Bacteroides sp.]